jgi:hypothetical protein
MNKVEEKPNIKPKTTKQNKKTQKQQNKTRKPRKLKQDIRA